MFSSWEDDPATSTIERVRLTELDFPAVTVCPEFASDKLAVRTILNMSAESALWETMQTFILGTDGLCRPTKLAHETPGTYLVIASS